MVGRQLRADRFRLRRTAGRILGSTSRVARCGWIATGGHVDLMRRPDGRAHYAGLETCGSVWVCPVCGAKVAEGRRQEVEHVLEAHTGGGGAVYMAAFTIRHHAFQRCAELREAVALAWRKVQGGAPWQRLRERYSVVGSLRAMEVTHGDNGWHPHLHVLFATARELSPAEEAAMADALFDRWQAILARIGFGGAERAAFSFARAGNVAEAGAYVAKWGTAAELTKGQSKAARGTGRAPWQLLWDAGAGDKRAVALFAEYARAFKGARQLTWSKGFRERYGFGAETPDEELAVDTAAAAECIGTLARGVYLQVALRGLEARVLDAAETGGWTAVLILLQREGVHVGSGPPDRTTGPGDQARRGGAAAPESPRGDDRRGTDRQCAPRL